MGGNNELMIYKKIVSVGVVTKNYIHAYIVHKHGEGVIMKYTLTSLQE